jgi:predicted PurR-regulated permease PerM
MPEEKTAARLSPSRLVVSIAASLALLYFLRSILAPFFTAMLLVALIEGLVRALAHRWPAGPRWALILGAGVLMMLMLIGCGVVLVYGVQRIVADAPAIIERLDQLAVGLSRDARLTHPLRVGAFVNSEHLMTMAAPLAQSLGAILGAAALTGLFMAFMLASRGLLMRKLEIIAKTHRDAERLEHVIARIARSAGNYMWVQTVTGAIVGGACGAVIYLAGVHDALFWGVLIFLLAYIPVVGVTIGTVSASLFALVQFPTYWQAIAVFVSTQIIASLAGNVLLPKMQADTQNLDPTASIFAVALWTLLWGVQGALLAVPLTVMLMIVCNQFEQSRWAAVLISNDGVPEGAAPGSRAMS